MNQFRRPDDTGGILDEDGMRIFVIFYRDYEGDEVFVLEGLQPTDTISTLKQMIQQKKGIPKEFQRITINKDNRYIRQSESDNRTLETIGLENEDTIGLELS